MIRKTRDHLKMVNESYPEHLGFALQFSLRMIAGGIGGLIHAIIPAFHQTTASSTVRALHKEMEDRLSSYKHEHK
jgi:hypothetical protein